MVQSKIMWPNVVYSLSCKLLLDTLSLFYSMSKIKEQTSSKKSRYHHSMIYTENSQRSSFHKSVEQEETYSFQQLSETGNSTEESSSLKQISNEKSNAVS